MTRYINKQREVTRATMFFRKMHNVLFIKCQKLSPSDDVCDMVSFSSTAVDDDYDVMSTAASNSGDWSC